MKAFVASVLGFPLYAFLWIVGGIVYILPWSFKKNIARLGALFWFYVVRFRVKIILHNLSLVFPRRKQESMPEFRARCELLARQNLEHYLLSFMEVLERFHWGPSTLARRVVIEGREHLEELQKSGRGFFILSSHIGNWEMITAIGVLLGVRLAIITKFLRNGFFDQLWVRSRKRFGLELIPERHSGLQVARAVRDRQRAVGFILDQHTGEPHGLESEFLGHRAWTPKGLAILSNRLNADILPAYLIRDSEGQLHLKMEPALRAEKIFSQSGFRTESGSLSSRGLSYHLRLCNEIMERWTYAAPAQYLWLHKRFKNFHNYRAPLVWEP